MVLWVKNVMCAHEVWDASHGMGCTNYFLWLLTYMGAKCESLILAPKKQELVFEIAVYNTRPTVITK